MINHIIKYKQDVVELHCNPLYCKYDTLQIDEADKSNICCDLRQEEALLEILKLCFQNDIKISLTCFSKNNGGILNLTQINKNIRLISNVRNSYIKVYINTYNSLFRTVIFNPTILQKLEFINYNTLPFEKMKYWDYKLSDLFGEQFYYIRNFQELFDDIRVLEKFKKL